ncbi:hypothetical protein CQZ98_28510 [Pseudomonas sp. MYb115]|nr:hypothetical protein CQZ98_28510 [Pseudomonas sp. MYb115]
MNSGFIVFDKDPNKYKYELKEWSDFISRGNINMDDTLILESARSAVTITFEIAGDFRATVTIRLIKNSFTTEKFTVHSLLTHAPGTVILPGVRVTAAEGKPHQVKWVTRITIQMGI